jgi:hypothetical protein
MAGERHYAPLLQIGWAFIALSLTAPALTADSPRKILPKVEIGIDRSNMATECTILPPGEPNIYPFNGPYNGAVCSKLGVRRYSTALPGFTRSGFALYTAPRCTKGKTQEHKSSEPCKRRESSCISRRAVRTRCPTCSHKRHKPLRAVKMRRWRGAHNFNSTILHSPGDQYLILRRRHHGHTSGSETGRSKARTAVDRRSRSDRGLRWREDTYC